MKIPALAVLLGACTAATAASAQTWYDPSYVVSHSYVEVEGGATVQGRTKIDINAAGLGSLSQSASHSDDFFGGALAGYSPLPWLSVEAEGIYSRDNLAYSPTNPVFGVGGATRTYGGLGNLRLSLPFEPSYTVPLPNRPLTVRIKPYIGAGAGYGNIQYTGQNGVFTYNDNNNGFMWQGKAGVEFRAGQHLGLDIAYRYLESPDYDRPGSFNSPGYDARTHSHSQAVTAGLKYYF